MGRFHSLISVEKKQEDASFFVFFTYEKYSQHGRVSEPCTEIPC